MKNKSNLSRIVAKVKTPTSGEIMAAANRGDKQIDGAEVLKKPPVSEAQRRFMGAASRGDVEGVSPKVGKKFLQEDPGGKLPERVEKASNPVVAKPDVTLPKPEQLHMPGHEKWNNFVNMAAADEEDRGGHGARAMAAGKQVPAGQGIENARILALNAQRAKFHLDNAVSHIGVPNFKEVSRAFREVAKGRRDDPENEARWQQMDQEAVGKMAKPEFHEEARGSVLQGEHHSELARRYLHTLGIPQEHHEEILQSATQFGKGGGVKKSMGNIMGKLRKALPSAKEDKQEAGDKSPSLDRVTAAPEEGKTRPFIDSKTAIAALKEQQKRFKHKVEQDRCDGDAKKTGIYSMNEASVEQPLEKAAPSYKTLRSVKLPDGQKVNVYGNNGYERISNGQHRGRYLHSVMAEHKLGRKLGANEEIDHKNGDRQDNSHSNMRVTTTSEHASHTNTARAQQGGFTGDKRYMHSREYTEGAPEAVKKAEGGKIRSILKKCNRKG